MANQGTGMDNFELTLKIGAFAISCALFIKGIWEYSKAQKWKKAEFVSKEIKEFHNDFDIKRALILLDWNANEIALKPNELHNSAKMHFTDKLIVSALRTHNETPTFSDEEVIIKSIFDAFLDRICMFENYVETGLIKIKDIKPYLIYWIEILADMENKRKSAEVRAQMWKYIDEYGFFKVRSFCEKMDY